MSLKKYIRYFILGIIDESESNYEKLFLMCLRSLLNAMRCNRNKSVNTKYK